MTPSRGTRRLLPFLVALVLAVAGCSSGDSGDSGDSVDVGGSDSSESSSESAGGDAGGSSDTGGTGNQMSALGVSFDAPEGWQTIDPAETDPEDDVVKELAEGLGTTPEQFAQNMKSVDLFVVDDDGPQDGFLANINMLDQPGQLPPDDQFEQQFSALGAKVNDLSHEDSEVGEVVAVSYTLPLQGHQIEGVSYLFQRDEDVLTVTISTLDRKQSDEIGGTILDTLAEDG